MRNSKITELNSALELLNENELYSFKGGLDGGQSDIHDIPEVIIPTPGGDDGGGDDDGGDPPTWDDNDPPYDDGEDPFPPSGGDDGGGNGVNDIPADTFGEIFGLTLAERSFLAHEVSVLDVIKMVKNYNLAVEKGNGINNEADAMRHALWSALDAADIGVNLARQFHTLHETEHPGTPSENAMDLHNNEWGYNWFIENGDPADNMSQFEHDFNNAVLNGFIITHP